MRSRVIQPRFSQQSNPDSSSRAPDRSPRKTPLLLRLSSSLILLPACFGTPIIPSITLNSENVARWLGSEFGATVVLVGTAKGIVGSNTVELSARFLSVADKNRIGPSAEANLTPSESLPDLSPIALPELPPLGDTVEGEPVYRAGLNGVGLPKCLYNAQSALSFRCKSLPVFKHCSN
jgi:hypothetical protein